MVEKTFAILKNVTNTFTEELNQVSNDTKSLAVNYFLFLKKVRKN